MADVELDFILQEVTVEVQSPEIDLTLDLNSLHVNGVPSYTHLQTQESATWIINHNLGYKPIVQLFNSGSQMIMGSISHVSNTQTFVTFTIPITGFARLI